MTLLKPLAFAVAAGTLLTGGVYAFAQTPDMPANAAPAPAVTKDAFVKTASVSDMFEIASSELALKRSQNAEVKAFAQQMIADHTKSSTELKAAAASDGVSVAAGLDAKHQEQLNMLQGTPAADFDARYLAAQANAHVEAVTLFDAYAASGEEGAVKAFAAKTLPTLKMHLDHVKGMTPPK